MTNIEWTDVTWNCIRGCSRVSEGCRHCYAENMAARFSGPGKPYEGLAVFKHHKPQWTGEVRFVPEMLAKPLSWRKPRKVFVNSMSDLFHEKLTNEQIAAVFGVMASCPHHTFQVLTKRPARMVEWFNWATAQSPNARTHVLWEALREEVPTGSEDQPMHAKHCADPDGTWPLPNVWLGVSCENQATANERIPLLLQTSAAVRFVSAEPLLDEIDFEAIQIPGERAGLRFSALRWHNDDRFGQSDKTLDWVICGGESGPGARVCDVEWVRSIVKQCREAGTACFVKQLGSKPYGETGQTIDDFAHVSIGDPRYVDEVYGVVLRDKKGGDMSEFPEDLRVRQFPEVSK